MSSPTSSIERPGQADRRIDRSAPLYGARRYAVLGVAALLLVCVSAIARAERGAYFTESFGFAVATSGLAHAVGTPLHLRLAIGMRLGNLAIEPWILSDLQTQRDGAFGGIVGGDPKSATGDLNSMGIDAKYIVGLHRHVAGFVRGGPLVADGTGALMDYHGRGLGVAGGVQVTGKVRALGFLWAPLFFVKKGPMVTGALLVDAGYDFYFLRSSGAPPIDARVGHVSIGFAIGSAF